nr:hypothetical protein [Tanacetum cinerariifolium]
KATVNPQVSTRDKHAIDVEPIVPRLRNNRDAHLDYLRHLKESVETIRDIVEEAKVVRPRDRSIVSTCRYTKHSQELLEYAIGTCPQGSQQRAKQLAHIPLIRKKQVTIAKPSDKSDINRISPAKGDNKLPVDDQPRKNKSHLRTSNCIDSSSRLKRIVINSHSDSIGQTCNKCLTPFNHDLCVATCLQSAMATPFIHYNNSVERKVKQVWKPKQVRQVWKPTCQVLTTIGHQRRPTCRILHLGKQCPLTRFTPPKVVSAKQSKKRARTCANQMEPNHNWGSKVSNVPSLSGFKCRSYRLSFDKMADVNAPSGQTSTMAPPVRANDQILPHIRWVPIGKSNCYMDLEKSQSNPIYKIAVDLLKNTNFFRAFTASSTIPSIYIQQLWDTILYDKKAGCYKCQLDEQWFDLTKETLREAIQITPVNNNQAFVAPPSIDGLIDFVNQLGYLKLVMNLSNVVTNDLFQLWRALLTIINLCLTGKTSGFKRPRAPVLQILWGIVKRTNINYSERIWEEFTQSIHTFIKDKRNLSRHTSRKKRATLIMILSIRFTKLIIHHLQRKHSANSTKSEVFGMPIPNSLITAKIQQATYYREYLAKVTHQNPPAPKSTQPARKPKGPTRPSISIPVASTQPAPTSAPAKSQENKRKQATETTDKLAKAKRIKHSISRKTRQPRSSPKSVGASKAEEVPAKEPQVADEDADYQKALEESMKDAYALPKGPLPPVVADEDADYQKALEESMKDAYALPKGPLPPVVIRELESGKYQPLPEVPRKGKAKVTEEQVVLGAEEGGQDEGQAGPDPDAQAEDQMRSDAGAQAEGQARSNPNETSKGQAGSNPDETSKGQAGPDPGDVESKVQSISSPVVYVGSDREHMDLDVADVSPQPSTEQLDERFTATVYPNVQENLKLAVEEPVLLEEPSSSSGTLSSL